MQPTYLQHEGGQIAYETHGDAGPLILMTPGIGDIRNAYRFLAPALVKAGYRAAVMDLRGHGQSSVGWGEYTPAAVGRDMLTLVEQLGGAPAILVGASMAAASAVWAAAEAPRLVAGVICVGPSLRDPQLSALQRVMVSLITRGPWKISAWCTFYRSLYPVRQPDDLADHIARLRVNLAEPGRYTSLRAFMQASKAVCTARMAVITQPTLVVMGSRDPDYASPAAEATWMSETLRGEHCIITDSGHYPHADAPAEVMNAILPFLEKVAGRS